MLIVINFFFQFDIQITKGYDSTVISITEVRPVMRIRSPVFGVSTQFQEGVKNLTYTVTTSKPFKRELEKSQVDKTTSRPIKPEKSPTIKTSPSPIKQLPEMKPISKSKINPDAITSAKFSRYYLVTPSEQLVQGSMIHVAIEARDQEQQPMVSGGDYWHAVMSCMSTNQPHQASTAGRIVDYNNGTYSAYFYAAWSGHAEINITLVHPSIAVRFLHDKLWHIGPKVFWSATFQKNASKSVTQKIQFDTLCWITSKDLKTNTTCEYPERNQALGNYTFVCNQSQDGHCRPLDKIAINVGETAKEGAIAVGDHGKYFQR